jgi:hypothetical protein
VSYRVPGLGIIYASAAGGTFESPVRDDPELIESLSPTDAAGAERTARMLLRRAENEVTNAEAAYGRLFRPGEGLILTGSPYMPLHDASMWLRSRLADLRAVVAAGPWPGSLDEPGTGARDRAEDILGVARALRAKAEGVRRGA